MASYTNKDENWRFDYKTNDYVTIFEGGIMETITLDSLTVPIMVEYLEEDEVYKISCPLLPGCYAWGETLDEAMRSIPGNIRAMLEARRAKHAPIPALFEETNQHTPFVLRMVPA